MPILAREPDIYPADLLDVAEPEEADSSQWWAIYTMSRREKQLMRHLRKLDVPFYGPIIPQKHRSPNGRMRVAYVPLFTGYVFIRGTLEHRRLALTTHCVSRTLEVPDPVSLTRDLQRIHQMIAAKVSLSPESQIPVGTKVRIREGALTGLEGIVIKRQGQERLFVAVQFLQQGASIALQDFQVEQVE